MRFLAPVVLLLCCISGSAQHPFFRNYTTSDGLPTVNVYYVTQDSKGYIWLGTDGGACRYDGYSFERFTTDDGLSDNEILQVHEDDQSRLWFLTMNGKPSWYSNGRFSSPRDNATLEQSALPSSLLTWVQNDSGHIVFSSLSGGLSFISPDGRVSQLLDEFLSPALVYTGGNIYAVTGQGVGVIDPVRTTFTLLDSAKYTGVCRAASVDGDILFSFGTQLFLFNTDSTKTRSLAALPAACREILSLDVLDNASIWIGTRRGLFVANSISDLQRGRLRTYLHDRQVSCTFQDREGNLWAATLESGLYFMPSTEVITYREPLGSDRISAISRKSDGSIWIGGLQNRYYVIKGGWETLYDLDAEWKTEIVNIRHFDDGSTWACGKSVIARITGRRTQYLPHWANDILRDNDGNYWLAGQNVGRYAKASFESQLATGPRVIGIEPDTVIAEVRANCLLLDRQTGAIWIGTSAGLLCWREDELVDYSTTSRYLSSSINALRQLSDGTVLVATEISGLVLLRDETVTGHFGADDGLSSSACNAVALGGNNTIWIGTLAGVDRMHLGNDTVIENFSSQTGMGRFRVNAIETLGDTVFVGTDNGLLRFATSRLLTSNTPPRIHITGFEVGHDTQDMAGLLSFPYNQNDVRIRFTGLAFRDHAALSYRYILEGADKAWQSTTTREVNYLGLPPGSYTFRVQAVNGAGLPSEEVAAIAFAIRSPFWQRWWFIGGSIVGGLLVIWSLYALRVRSLRRSHELQRTRLQAQTDRAQLERDIAELEQKALRLQMNPHFIFNALNTIKGYYAENKDIEANTYITRFAKLLRLILESNEQLIPLERDLEMLQLYLELVRARYNNKFDFTIEIDAAVKPSDTGVPPMLLQPFVENAIIHGVAPKEGKGKIEIRFSREDGTLICTVQDDGIGFEASAERNKNRPHQSKAIEITRERLELLEQRSGGACHLEITDISSNGSTGTLVTIRMPVKQVW